MGREHLDIAMYSSTKQDPQKLRFTFSFSYSEEYRDWLPITHEKQDFQVQTAGYITLSTRVFGLDITRLQPQYKIIQR